MNARIDIAAACKKPARPNMEVRLSALMDLEEGIRRLKQAAYVLDGFLDFEFDASDMKDSEAPFSYCMHGYQRDGLTYMFAHVRELATELERSFGRATSDDAELIP